MPLRSLITLLLLVNLGLPGLGAQDQLSGSLIVYAATSLTDVFESMRDEFEASHPDVEVLLNFANSATLAAQLRAGAPADIFASANELQMTVVADYGRVDEADVQIFAHNRLVLIVPADNPAAIQALEDLARDGILLVLAAGGTPIRSYTDAMLASASDEIGGDFLGSVLNNLVSEESNVRQVVARIALGEADAGLVYRSDAIGDVASQIIAIPIDERHNQIASYPIARLLDSTAPPLAEAFMRFVLSEAAQPILADFGFCWPPKSEAPPTVEATPAPARASQQAAAAAEIDCEVAPLEDR
ncbi:MAG: molybdate ABC transporter substrate-binding protein [Chloroflexi bacterium]|nr:molybdate ABC transporter substrate-binding protein [Chloroflexota bacterium]